MKLLHSALSSVAVSGKKGVYAEEEGGRQWEGASWVGVYKWKQNSHTATDLSVLSAAVNQVFFFFHPALKFFLT